jgi:hypothetical protein
VAIVLPKALRPPRKRWHIVLSPLHPAPGGRVDAAAITLRVMELRGQDVADARLDREMIERTRNALARQQRKGLVRATQGAGQIVLWTIARFWQGADAT